MIKTRTVKLKETTIKLLDDTLVKMVNRDRKNKTFDLDSFIRNRRGISFDEEIESLCKFYTDNTK